LLPIASSFFELFAIPLASVFKKFRKGGARAVLTTNTFVAPLSLLISRLDSTWDDRVVPVSSPFLSRAARNFAKVAWN